VIACSAVPEPRPPSPEDDLTRSLDDERLRLFAFTAAPERRRYLGLLRAFERGRERSRLQLGPADVAALIEDAPPADALLPALDQLQDWGLLDRLQDDRKVRTIAEYRQRRSLYQVTELGWLAWRAVESVLAAEPGEVELRRLALTRVRGDLEGLAEATRNGEGERVGLLLDEVHSALDDLAQRAARFTLACGELAAAWEVAPAAFLAHKQRLLSHLDGFLRALSAERPLLGAAMRAVEDAGVDRMLELAAASSTAVIGEDGAMRRATERWAGVVGWFVDAAEEPSQANLLEARTIRAIRDLAALLKRVLDSASGGVSRATWLEDLAAWFVACPDDDAASALASATSGLRCARHFGVPEPDPEAVHPSTPWADAAPAPVDTSLRRRGRPSPPSPPAALPDLRRETRLLRDRQQARREAEAAAASRLDPALREERPLDDLELTLLLRLLTRALQTRRPAEGTAETTRGRVRLRLEPSEGDAAVVTERGRLVLPSVRLTVEPSTRRTAP
jgi:uncharacterized protein (TIGR02677 family)